MHNVSSRSKVARKSTSLKSGRPPLSSSSVTSPATGGTSKVSSKATRTLIRAHHNLHKSRAKALADGNHTLVATLDAEIGKLGGLDAYQLASLTGQSKDRGGDSSAILVRWLAEAGLVGKSMRKRQQEQPSTTPDPMVEPPRSLRVLEIGALSSQNEISSMVGRGIGSVKRIDLKSQEPDDIEEIDFMQFPIPKTAADRYDILSLSLVLNYVPDARGRGEMLKRTRLFLREGDVDSRVVERQVQQQRVLPCLFVVLPLPCISNSRYMTPSRFRELMYSLGYESIKVHQSAKLHYELFRYMNDHAQSQQSFKKMEINPGKGRNNFCITVEAY